MRRSKPSVGDLPTRDRGTNNAQQALLPLIRPQLFLSRGFPACPRYLRFLRPSQIRAR